MKQSSPVGYQSYLNLVLTAVDAKLGLTMLLCWSDLVHVMVSDSASELDIHRWQLEFGVNTCSRFLQIMGYMGGRQHRGSAHANL